MQGGIFSTMIGTSAYLLLREKPAANDLCNFDFVCQNCNKNSHCQLPEASKYRYQKRVNK
jgi:hypothetical protein